VSERGPSDESTLLSSEGTPRPFTQAKELEIGARLGQFRVEARIGQGGRGVVYRAYDEKLRRQVALKVLVDASSGSSVWLLEEARAAAALMHPSIAAIHDVQQQEGVVFIVMELVPGATLRAELKRGPLSVAMAFRYARDIASGLACAHRSGVVHRDLKPENVMVTPEGNAKILDFGLARAAPDTPPPSGEVGATGIAGTPGYMGPEQSEGRRVDARADVFSFGVVLWEMLAGERPFERTKDRPSPSADAWKPVAPLDQLAPYAPRELVRIAERCLAFDRAARFADAQEVLEALRAHDSVRPKSARRIPRVAVLVSVALVGSGAVFLGTRGRDRPRAPGGEGPSGAGAEVPTGPTFALSSPPEKLTDQGLCSFYPAFASDGSLVYSRQDEHAAEIHRLDLTSGGDTTLTHDDQGASLRPAAGPPGQVLYMFERKGQEGGREIRTVPLRGGAPSTLAQGEEPAFGAGALFFLAVDGRGIRRRATGGVEDLLYEAHSASLFRGIAVSADGAWLLTGDGSAQERSSIPLCIAALGRDHAPLDCTSQGSTTSSRGAFSPRGGSAYFGRGESIVRMDLETRATEAVRVSPAPTTLAIAPDGSSVVFSSCRIRYEALRIDATGTATLLHAFDQSAGGVFVGPHGELAFPVARGDGFALGVADAGAESVRLVTNGDHDVTEAAFSPDGRRVVFHDATPATGGLFVVDLGGMSELHRVTSDDRDNLPSWLDAEHVIFMHPEKGLPFGRVFVVSAAGGEPRVLPQLPGVLLGGVPSRGTLLLALRSSTGDRFAEATVDGKVHDLPLRGVPRGMHWDVETSASPSGRYVAWFSEGVVWRADLEAGAASRIDFKWPRGLADGIQPDDEGRVAVDFRHAEGQLYRARGRFP
jgi:hypothetical protein